MDGSGPEQDAEQSPGGLSLQLLKEMADGF